MIDPEPHTSNAISPSEPIGSQFQVVLSFVASMWVVHGLDGLFRLQFNQYGLVPRTLHGLIGVVTMPMLHATWGHLLSNTVPLVVMLMLMVATNREPWQKVSEIWIFGGALLWCLGRPGLHIGASGLVYGLIAYLIAFGLFDRKLLPIFISLVVGLTYGTSLIAGLLPSLSSQISWEAHLLSAVAGAIVAYLESLPDPHPADVRSD